MSIAFIRRPFVVPRKNDSPGSARAGAEDATNERPSGHRLLRLHDRNPIGTAFRRNCKVSSVIANDGGAHMAVGTRWDRHRAMGTTIAQLRKIRAWSPAPA